MVGGQLLNELNKPIKINTSSWKEVLITDLFEIKGGKGNIKNSGKYPQISAITSNNGHGGNSDIWKYENCLTCAKDGVYNGYTSWHPYKFDVNSHVNILIPKFKYTDNICLFLSVIITKSLSPKYDYGKALGIARLSQESIFLPFKDDEIDWEWIEEFMKNIEIKKKEISLIEIDLPNKINTDSWKEFKLIDLFDMNLSKKELGNGEYWEVSGQTTNNGRKCLINKYNQENIFTISSVGAYCGTAFWHPYKFWLGNNVQGYKPKFKVTDNIATFLCTILTKTLTPKFSYGKTASIERLKQESIFLPTKEDKPDWDYMETFMENLIENDGN